MNMSCEWCCARGLEAKRRVGQCVFAFASGKRPEQTLEPCFDHDPATPPHPESPSAGPLAIHTCSSAVAARHDPGCDFQSFHCSSSLSTSTRVTLDSSGNNERGQWGSVSIDSSAIDQSRKSLGAEPRWLLRILYIYFHHYTARRQVVQLEHHEPTTPSRRVAQAKSVVRPTKCFQIVVFHVSRLQSRGTFTQPLSGFRRGFRKCSLWTRMKVVHNIAAQQDGDDLLLVLDVVSIVGEAENFSRCLHDRLSVQ
ncbi:hypothetical protein IWZ01DRAFT_306308 [Phyllosticta capitalensis]